MFFMSNNKETIDKSNNKTSSIASSISSTTIIKFQKFSNKKQNNRLINIRKTWTKHGLNFYWKISITWIRQGEISKNTELVLIWDISISWELLTLHILPIMINSKKNL